MNQKFQNLSWFYPKSLDLEHTPNPWHRGVGGIFLNYVRKTIAFKREEIVQNLEFIYFG